MIIATMSMMMINKNSTCEYYQSCCIAIYDPVPEVHLDFTKINPAVGSCGCRNLKSHLVRIQSLNVLHLKPGVGQYIAIHATLTARDFFLAYFYPFGPFTCIFSKTFPDFFCVGCG